MSQQSNPFAGLMGTSEAKAVTDTDYNSDKTFQKNSDQSLDDENVQTINNVVEDVFHFTINPLAIKGQSTKQLVFLEELAQAISPRIFIDLEALEQALFERLLLQDIEQYVLPKSQKVFKEHVIQKQVFPYLFSAMQNLQSYEQINTNLIKDAVQKMKELIFRNAVTALKQPALFEGQDFSIQLVDLLRNVDPQCHVFFIDLVKAFMSEDSEENQNQLRETMLPVLNRIHTDVNKCNIINLPIYILPSIQLFASNTYLAPILMDVIEPKNQGVGRFYEDTVIGALLGLSVLPRNNSYSQHFFDNPMDPSATSMVETSVWSAASHLTNNMHKIFLTLLKAGPSVKNRLLSWIGKCLKANVSRGKLANMGAEPLTATTVSDGFMLNLGAVLLQLCQPFCSHPDDPKALKIDPTYCAVPPEESAAKSVHLTCLYDETCLLPARQDENGETIKRPTADSYNFVTECFFMTQKCIDLGVRVSAEKLWRYGQELARTQRALGDPNTLPHLMETLRTRAQHLMKRYLSLRCALLESDALTNLHRLQATTCTWLAQVAARNEASSEPRGGSYAPASAVPISLPLTTTPPPDSLRCIPEFVLENIVVLITMARRTVGAITEEADVAGLLQPALTLVLIFMGDSSRTYNPHLRARLAECLEAMLPNHPEDQQPLSNIASFHREQLFKENPHRLQLVPCLLEVFVGIEMTGQSVQFEQKFNYRRPMYLVMDFLWGIEEHREVFTRLADEAEANMEAVHPPIFLRFVNLLMNDAIFLLDEALGNMAQIRTLQTEQESGAWDNLSAQERAARVSSLSHIGTLARFDNLLGRDTVRALVRLTAHAPKLFVHDTLADRVAAMLNYFLLHLVGPNKKNFKVKDMKEYEFDPARTVLDICRMYVQLGGFPRFCAAVSDDGRSYSPQLFQLAEDVLVRIGGGALITSLREVAARVGTVAEQRQRDEEILANAPEEFLDPIMSTIMLDPVVLPSSRTTVDRTTIARHLLSDQSDPFNRSPLSMDQVKSNTELKKRIHAWIAEQKQTSQNPGTSSTHP